MVNKNENLNFITLVFQALLLMMLMLSCTNQGPLREIPQANFNSGSSSDTPQTTQSSLNVPETFSWYLARREYAKSLVINDNNQRYHYLFGQDLNTYLLDSNYYQGLHCLEISFEKPLLKNPKPLLLKATAQVVTDFVTRERVRFWRFNFVDTQANLDCLNIPPFAYAAPSSYALKTDDVCTDCLNFIQSKSIKLYRKTGASTSMELTDFDLSELTLRLNVNQDTQNSSGSCTNEECSAQGFDCCLEGQCVREGAPKLQAQLLYPSEFQVAQSQVLQDPTKYLNYPQFYYICLERPDDGFDIPVDPTDPQGESNDRVAALILDYNCINELDEKSLQTPFHRDPLNIGTNPPITQCNTTDTTDTLYYEKVMTRLYQNCGCSETELSKMVMNCPPYTYKLKYKIGSDGNLTTEVAGLECVAPPVENDLPFQDLNVALNAKSAPHRFFDQTGNEHVFNSTPPSDPSVIQEGIEFKYLTDDRSFYDIGSVDLNMNAILGNMKTDLSQALPALQVKLEFDRNYYIAVLDGFYSPCPSCAKDSWFLNFSNLPPSQQGLGLRASNFSSSRDAWGNNQTLGNYEDTHFGRACYVPPTMIPFSHRAMSDVTEQRRHRLQTQAAFYSNGYQKDWYGFNLGAVIGSFDGVSWFAIGKGRIVTAQSDRLFLAINAPIADLALASNHTVSIQEYDEPISGARFDYNFEEEINGPSQNEAGQCQKNHVCETDSDCVTQLGWEYRCVDINLYQTKWPVFEAEGAKETANAEREAPFYFFRLQQGLAPGASNKRCAYRGRGAPCLTSFSSTDEQNKVKALSCATNFECRGVEESGVFNRHISRLGASLENSPLSPRHLFGMDSDMITRPLNYHGQLSLTNPPYGSDPNAIVDNIKNSLGSNAGLCVPKENSDFINQIGKCREVNTSDSAIIRSGYVADCPVFDQNQNIYVDIPPASALQTLIQNACSNESRSSAGTNAYALVEKLLDINNPVINPTMASLGCMRRASSPCHTNLDCYPNALHAEQTQVLNPNLFGNELERQFISEALVCSQAKRSPVYGQVPDAEFNSYTVRNNRCCRPVGQNISMYTEDTPDNPLTSNTLLSTDGVASLNPTDPKRYSRYNTAVGVYTNKVTANVETDPSSTPTHQLLSSVDNIKTPNQWKAIDDTGKRTCCGGSWVRKFADGTNNWAKNRLNLDVRNFACLNFRSPLVLTEFPTRYGLTENQLSSDVRNYCIDGTQTSYGCAQYNHLENGVDDFFQDYPATADTTARDMVIISAPEYWESTDWKNNTWSFFPPWSLTGGGLGAFAELNFSETPQDTYQNGIYHYIHVRLPSFVTTIPPSTEPFSDLSIVEYRNGAENGSSLSCTPLPASVDRDIFYQLPLSWDLLSTPGSLQRIIDDSNYDTACTGAIQCCYHYDPTTRELKVSLSADRLEDSANYGGGGDEVYYGIIFNYTAPGTAEWESEKSGDYNNASVRQDHTRSSKPASPLNYLKKMARFEYLGIPQMTYEPILCNDIMTKVVPGLFNFAESSSDDDELVTIHDVESLVGTTPGIFRDPSAQQHWDLADPNKQISVDQRHVNHTPIFSASDFTCCLKANSFIEVNESSSRCCSGYAIDVEADPQVEGSRAQKQCKIPQGTDLYVYFNKFVSSEGMGDISENPNFLTYDDFDAQTGEPLSGSNLTTVGSENVRKKILNLGREFCEHGEVIQGGAFGPFESQEPVSALVPQNQGDDLIYSFVDSIRDTGNFQGSNVGFEVFSQGFRWNHHLYCSPPQN